MIAASLFALVLAQAEAPPISQVSAPAPAPADTESDIPKGAPADDYGLVAWCRGALTGHMALYPLVKPELRSIERPGEVASDETDDQEQMKAGRDYLALYKRAMLAAEKESPTVRQRGEAIQAQGQAIWTAAKAAEPRTRMWSWLMWDLPGRCETAANRLETRSGLLGQAFRSPSDVVAPTPGATETPTPAATAETGAPASIDDALSPAGQAAAAPAASAPVTDQPQTPPALRGPQ